MTGQSLQSTHGNTGSMFPQSQENMYTKTYDTMLKLTHDPHKEIADMAQSVVTYINAKFVAKLRSPIQEVRAYSTKTFSPIIQNPTNTEWSLYRIPFRSSPLEFLIQGKLDK